MFGSMLKFYIGLGMKSTLMKINNSGGVHLSNMVTQLIPLNFDTSSNLVVMFSFLFEPIMYTCEGDHCSYWKSSIFNFQLIGVLKFQSLIVQDAQVVLPADRVMGM